MSTDARLQERPIRETILPRSRRAPELPSLPIAHVPTRSRRHTPLSPYAPDSHRARYSGSCLNGRLRSPRVLFKAGSKADRTLIISSNLMHLVFRALLASTVAC